MFPLATFWGGKMSHCYQRNSELPAAAADSVDEPMITITQLNTLNVNSAFFPLKP